MKLNIQVSFADNYIYLKNENKKSSIKLETHKVQKLSSKTLNDFKPLTIGNVVYYVKKSDFKKALSHFIPKEFVRLIVKNLEANNQLQDLTILLKPSLLTKLNIIKKKHLFNEKDIHFLQTLMSLDDNPLEQLTSEVHLYMTSLIFKERDSQEPLSFAQLKVRHEFLKTFSEEKPEFAIYKKQLEKEVDLYFETHLKSTELSPDLISSMLLFKESLSNKHLSSLISNIERVCTNSPMSFGEMLFIMQAKALLEPYMSSFDDAMMELYVLIDEINDTAKKYISSFNNKDVFTEDELKEIFTLAALLENLKEKASSAEKGSISQLIDLLKPALKSAHLFLERHPTLAMKAEAAAIGRAATRGISTMQTLIDFNAFFKPLPGYINQVFLISETGSVLKKLHPRAIEEEEIITQLLFIQKRVHAPSFKMKQLMPSRYGINNESDHPLLKTLSQEDINEIFLYLSNEEIEILKFLKLQESKYKIFKKRSYFIQKGENWSKISFEELFQLFKSNSSSDLKLKTDRNAAELTLTQLLSRMSALNDALHFESLYSKIAFAPTDSGWELVLPQAYQKNPKDNISLDRKFEAMQNLEAKEFMSNMILGEVLNENDLIFDLLDPEAFFDMILTGELQFKDLHRSNVGFAPILTQEIQKFNDFKFFLNEKGKMTQHPLYSLILNYQDGALDEDTVISYQAPEGEEMQASLKDIPGLIDALNVPWRIVLFDLDQTMGEDNFIALRNKDNEITARLPLRSAFLEWKLKDFPLPEDTLKLLYNSKARDRQSEDWILQKHSAIRKRMSSESQKEADAYILQYFKEPQYCLSTYRKNNINYPFKEIKEQFATDLSDLTQHAAFWESINKEVQKNKYSVDLTANTQEAERSRKKVIKQLMPRLSWNQLEAYRERVKKRKEYLQAYKDLTESKGAPEKIRTLIDEIVKSDLLPFDTLYKTTFKDNIEAKKHDVEKLRQYVVKEMQPTYFKVMCLMYPLLADTYKLNEILGLRHEKRTLHPGETIGYSDAPLELSVTKGLAYPPNSLANEYAKIIEKALHSNTKQAYV